MHQFSPSVLISISFLCKKLATLTLSLLILVTLHDLDIVFTAKSSSKDIIYNLTSSPTLTSHNAEICISMHMTDIASETIFIH